MRSLIILASFILDLIFGDPQWRWHPVRIIGRGISQLEKILNTGTINKKLGGVMLVVIVVGLTTFCVWYILKLTELIHPILHYIVSMLLIYFVLSIKSLGVEANKVCKALKGKDIKKAQENLSMLVGRDTDKLDEPEIIRATVETVAESIMDGIVAPLFYAFLGGPALAWAYKAINTLDSMVGHRSERFIEFGWASAKLDGLVNFIPAKITCFLISISAWFCRKDWVDSIKLTLQYLFKIPHYNSEATEAAMAGALGIQLGGLNYYSGLAIKKLLLGQAKKSFEISDINDSIRIAYLASIFGFLVFFIIFLFACPLVFGAEQIRREEIRVVSLAPSITEILFAIGLNKKEIVGVTNYCNYPKEANNISRIGSLTAVNIERIVSLRPDYIFSIGTESSPLNMRLKKVGLKVIISNPQNIEEIISNILMIGKIVRREKEAEAVIEQMGKRLNKIKSKAEKIQNKKKVYVEIWDDPLTSCGRGSLVDEIVTKAGGLNITGNINMLYPMISQEFIIRENPDFIILGYMSRDQKNTVNALLGRFGWQDISAVKNKNVICNIDPNIFLRPGPRIIDGIEEIHKRIYK